MASDDDAPLEQINKAPETLEKVEVAEAETAVKKRKRTRRSKRVPSNPEMGPPQQQISQLASAVVMTPPPSNNSNRTETVSSPSVSSSVEENNNGKSDYDKELEELLKRAESSIQQAGESLGEEKTQKMRRKRSTNVAKRPKHIHISGEERQTYQDIIKSSRQYQNALEMRKLKSGQADRVVNPLARFRQNQRNYLSK